MGRAMDRVYVYFKIPKNVPAGKRSIFYKKVFGGIDKVGAYTVKRRPKLKTIKKEGLMLVSIDRSELEDFKKILQEVKAKYYVFKIEENSFSK